MATDTIDFPALQQLIAAEAKTEILKLRAEHPDEHFYAYSLMTDSDVCTIFLATNTEEALKSYKEENGYDEDDESVRWFANEWVYGSEDDSFPKTQELIGAWLEREEDEDEFVERKEQALQAFAGALADLDKEKLFGKGKERNKVILMVQDTDPDEEAEEKAMDIILAINPKPAYRAYVEFCGGDEEDDDDGPTPMEVTFVPYNGGEIDEAFLSSIDFVSLLKTFTDETREAILEFRKSKEQFYGFSITYERDLSKCSLLAGSEGSVKKSMKKLGYSAKVIARELESNKWNIWRWRDSSFEDELFPQTRKIFSEWATREDNDDTMGILREKVIDMFVGALVNLDKEGMFGTGEERNDVILQVTVMNCCSQDITEMEHRIITTINPEAAYTNYKNSERLIFLGGIQL